MQKSLKDEIKNLEGKLEKNSNSILFARLADTYLQMDRVDDAIELCEKGLKKHPYYVTGHYVLGKCYLRKKLFDQAEKELKRVLLFDPKYIAAHRDYGELMAQIGWNNTCEMSYEEILRIDPLNEKAKARLEELREQLVLTKEEKPSEEESEMELEEVEEQILTKVSPPLEEELEEPPKEEFEEPESTTPPIVKELFKETENVLEDDKANLDLLEDIFRDDVPPDLSLNEEFDTNFENETISLEEESDITDQKYYFGSEYETEEKDKPEKREFEGLDDDDIFALMAGDNEIIKPESTTPIDKPRTEIPKKEKPRSEPRVEKSPAQIHKEDEPKFEPPQAKTFPEYQQEEEQKFVSPVTKPPSEVHKEQHIQVAGAQDMMDDETSQRKKEKIVTPTLGEIYAAQHQYAKAIGVYEILRRKDPDNELYKQKIEYLQKKLEESQSE